MDGDVVAEISRRYDRGEEVVTRESEMTLTTRSGNGEIDSR